MLIYHALVEKENNAKIIVFKKYKEKTKPQILIANLYWSRVKKQPQYCYRNGPPC